MYWIHHIPAQYENAAEVSPCIKIANIRLECKRAIICSLCDSSRVYVHIIAY
jgi:hypothetical protein